MKKTPGNTVIIPPEPFLERQIAHRLYAAKSPLYQELLDTLIVHPGRRYRDLQSLLRGRGDQVLTTALHKLADDGLLDQRGFGPKLSTYQLTSLGVAVRDVIVELRAADRNSAGAHDGSQVPGSA